MVQVSGDGPATDRLPAAVELERDPRSRPLTFSSYVFDLGDDRGVCDGGPTVRSRGAVFETEVAEFAR